MKNSKTRHFTPKRQASNQNTKESFAAPSNKPSPQRLIVVLGMHRSGTSAMTRGLQVMGVDLGDRLKPPAEGNNAKGFWEDVDLNALNIEMLQIIDSNWCHVAENQKYYIDILRKKGYFFRAVELLRQKLSNAPIFAFKDPRLAKLLPFWKGVFNHCQFEVSYLLAVRHPLSVVKSLAKRDDLEPEHSYLLWLSHVITSLIGSAGNQRVLVDYDYLMKSPEYQLNRIANTFDLAIDPFQLEKYKTEFLDQGLRHTAYQPNDLLLDDACPPLVREVYDVLLRVASEHLSINDAELQNQASEWGSEFIRIKPSLALTDRLYEKIINLRQLLGERDTLIHKLNIVVSTRDGHIAGLQQAVGERDGHIAGLQQALARNNAHATRLENSIHDIKASLSWKITRPARSLAQSLIGLPQTYRLLQKTLELGGGVYGSFALLIKVIAREGFRGIVWRLSNAKKLMNIPLALNKTSITEIQGEVLIAPVVASNNYQEWIRRYDDLTASEHDQIKQRIEFLASKPLISILMPTYNTPEIYLRKAIESVQRQLYENWELCISDDCSTQLHVRSVIKEYAATDPRIKVVYLEKNGHISRATNAALGLASGQFVALLDHDDELHPTALYCVVDAINQHPDAGLIYSDEDKINESGQRYDPYFKCEFNYELFLAQNMVSHLGVYRTSLIKEIGGFRIGFEGSQDYDLALRILEIISQDQVIHIPRVLYHWRAIPGSTALASGEKNYAAEAGRRAVGEHLQRVGIYGEVLPAPEAPAMNRVRINCPDPLPLVSIIIPTRDHADLLGMCIDSILERSSYKNYEIIVIDNGSVEPATRQLFERITKNGVQIIQYEAPFNYSAINNYGASFAKGQLLCLMNNDIEILTVDWLEEMVSFAIREDTGCVGSRLWYPDGELQHGGVILGIGGVANHAFKYLPRGGHGYFGRAVLHQSYSAVTAACLLVRRSVFEEVKGLDESLAIAFNDIDFCLRVRQAGYRNIWTPYAEMNHHESASRGSEDTPEKQARFAQEVNLMQQRWGDELLNDPAYSPNLTSHHIDFSYAWPPKVASLISLIY